jgi:hypothetical protein
LAAVARLGEEDVCVQHLGKLFALPGCAWTLVEALGFVKSDDRALPVLIAQLPRQLDAVLNRTDRSGEWDRHAKMRKSKAD